MQQKLTEVNHEVTTLKRKQDFQREVAKDIAQEVFANQVRIEPSKCRFAEFHKEVAHTCRHR